MVKRVIAWLLIIGFLLLIANIIYFRWNIVYFTTIYVGIVVFYVVFNPKIGSILGDSKNFNGIENDKLESEKEIIKDK